MNHKITDLKYLEAQRDGRFFACYEWEETVTINYTLPVYTNANSMTDKLGKSKTRVAVFSSDKVRRQSEKVAITKEQAKELMAEVLNNNGYLVDEKCSTYQIKWVNFS